MRAPATGLARLEPAAAQPRAGQVHDAGRHVLRRRGCRSCRSAARPASRGSSTAWSAATSARRGPRRRRRSRRRRCGGRRPARRSSVDAGDRAVAGDVDRAEVRAHLVDAGGVLGQPRGRSTRPSCTSTAPMAARHQASVPGRTWRWRSASSAVSVRRGSMTISARAGSRAISFSVVRARGKPCDCHGFLPTKTPTSACSKSPRTWVPSIWPLTQNSPVFSWASALERKRRAERGAGGGGVRAAEVVPLPAAAVVEDRRARRRCRARRRSGPRPRRSRCPSRSPRRCRRAAGAAARSGGAAVLVVVEAQRLLARVALRRRDGPCRRGCASKRRPSSPPRRTSMPQLHSQRMQAVGCQVVSSTQ